VSLSLLSQNNSQQIGLTIENDKLVLLDKYYTSGLFLTYKKNLAKDFIFKKNETNKLQLNLVLGQQTYTPTDMQSTNPNDFDRPYSGWLFLKSEIGKINTNSALFLAIETGITGEASLAGKLQTWWHETLNIEAPTWTQEIEQKFLINLKARYIKSYSVSNSQAFNIQVESSLGSKDIFLSNTLGYVFGRFNKFKQSTRHGFVDSTITNECFGFINLGYKYVAHNTLIQGSLDYNDVFFTTNRVAHIFKFNVGGVLKFKQNTLKFIFNYNTKETPKSTSHSYGTLSFSRDF